MNNLQRSLLMAIPAVLLSPPLTADIISYTDFGDWQANAGAYHTVTFTEFPGGTVLSDQYANLGVEFIGQDDLISPGVGLSDGFGIRSIPTDIIMEFSTPQFDFGVDYPGIIRIEAYSNGQQVFIDDFFITGFGGIVSDMPFDSIRLSEIGGPPIDADNIYFSIPAPGAFTLIALAGFMPRSRRRS